MAKRKLSTKALIEFGSEFRAMQALRRFRVAKLYLQGLTIRAIHKVLYEKFDCDVSIGTVWADIQAIQKDTLDLYLSMIPVRTRRAANLLSDPEPTLCPEKELSTIEIVETIRLC
jgi:transposase